MRFRIEVYTTRRMEYRMRRLSRWFRDTAQPVLIWGIEALTWIGVAGMIFFACGVDSQDLTPVIRGFLASAGITAAAAAIKWMLRG